MCNFVAFSQDAFDNAVKKAVYSQMETYPYSTLKDLYKNFFQDKFGPGHLIQDTTAAGNYLRKELMSYNETRGTYFEPTGWESNFYRVNLSVIKENIISYNHFFDAFVRSVNGIIPIPVETWEKEWHLIDSIIQSMSLSLVNYEADRIEIFNLLKKGNFVMHHSSQFETMYDPHYRIIEKSIFEQEIQPFLPK